MIIIIACAAILFILFFILLNQAYKRTNDYNNYCIDIMTYRKGIPENLKFVNLGSTYSKYAFGACKEMNIDAFDLSLQAQSLEMDKAILQQYIERMDTGCIVVVAVAAACLLLDREDRSNPLYCQILKRKNNPQFKWRDKVESEFPLLVHPKRAKRILTGVEAFESIYDSVPACMTLEESNKELESLVNVWRSLFHLKDLRSIDFSEHNNEMIRKNQQCLCDILDMCKNHRLTPVVVVPPFSERLNCYFSEEFKDIVINHTICESVKKRNVTVLNYQDDAEFQNSPELFVDGGFRLNKRGSMIFLRKLMKDLQKSGIYFCND
ncbi:MAG: hypothetical protein HDQ95_05495 [Roseburia sp.]|nr:hypothetical protein [Roseburia sp.]